MKHSLLRLRKRMDLDSQLIQELREGRGGRPGLPVPSNPYGPCGRKARIKEEGRVSELRSCVNVEVDVKARCPK